MKTYIEVVADTKDADYITRVTEISEGDLNQITPLIEAIKNFKPYIAKADGGADWTHRHNFPSGEHWREDLGEKAVEEIYADFDDGTLDLFYEFCPTGQFGIHTIKSVRVLKVTEETRLL